LGLAICDEIIRSHHGKLEIESEEGKGSTVRVQLPAFSMEGD
jgi:signal transduction histidine kinase